jgi:hypothetical protein
MAHVNSRSLNVLAVKTIFDGFDFDKKGSKLLEYLGVFVQFPVMPSL